MTKNYEIDCRDIFECTHEPEIFISQDGELVAARCRCGKVTKRLDEEEEKKDG
jgi:hypothetical protein